MLQQTVNSFPVVIYCSMNRTIIIHNRQCIPEIISIMDSFKIFHCLNLVNAVTFRAN